MSLNSLSDEEFTEHLRDIGILKKKDNFRRKIVGDCEIAEEIIKKEFKTKNTTRQIIERRVSKGYTLDCGHKIYVSWVDYKNPKTAFCCRCHSDSDALKELDQ